MKDGNMDEDGQGHVTMEISQWRDVEGDCGDYLTQTHTSRSPGWRESEIERKRQ